MKFVCTLAICILGASVGMGAATNGIGQRLQGTNVVSFAITVTNGAVEKEYEKLQAEDGAAEAEVARWIAENNEKAKGAGVPEEELEHRVHERLEPLRKAYDDFLSRHPSHVQARLDYGSFLSELHDKAGAKAQWEKALELEPQNPDAYNNLAGIYSATGPAQKAFEYCSKAIQLNPSNAIYYHNFGDTVYVLRKSAMENYSLNEQQVYAKALGLYSNAFHLNPRNFSFAWDLAQTYYVIKPLPTEDALRSWTNALLIAQDEIDRENVHLHLARIKMLAGRYPEARAQLSAVTNEHCLELKTRLIRNIEEREKP